MYSLDIDLKSKVRGENITEYRKVLIKVSASASDCLKNDPG
jgi:hypothetical protein